MIPQKEIQMSMQIASIFLFSASMMISAGLQAAGPGTITYQGTVVTGEGTAPPNERYPMHFALWNDPTGGAMLWDETYILPGVPVADGAFSVELGQREPLPAELFANQPNLWLEVQIDLGKDGFDAGDVYSPRVVFSAAPYAFQSDNAGMLEGLAADDFVHVAGDEMTGPLSLVTENNGTAVEILNEDANTGHGVMSTTNAAAGRAFSGEASDTGDGPNYGGYFTAAGRMGYGVFGQSSGNDGYGVWGVVTGTGGYGGHFSASGATGRGLHAYAAGENATALEAFAEGEGASIGGSFETGGATGRAVQGGARPSIALTGTTGVRGTQSHYTIPTNSTKQPPTMGAKCTPPPSKMMGV